MSTLNSEAKKEIDELVKSYIKEKVPQRIKFISSYDSPTLLLSSIFRDLYMRVDNYIRNRERGVIKREDILSYALDKLSQELMLVMQKSLEEEKKWFTNYYKLRTREGL